MSAETVEQMDRRFDPLMKRLQAELQSRHALAIGATRPAPKAQVLAALGEATTDQELERWLFQGAKAEEIETVLLGFWRLHLGLTVQDAEALRLWMAVGEAPTLKSACRAWVGYWPI